MRTIGRVTMGFLLLTVAGTARAQQVMENDAGYREKHFIYEVKEIDEFFERFNDDSASFIRKVYKDRHASFTPTRAKLVESLFNYKDTHWDTAQTRAFVADVTSATAPLLLDFMGDGWYAEVRCQFMYKGSEINIPLILKIEAGERGARWVIAAVKANPLKEEPDQIHLSGSPTHRTKFIDPASQGTNFMDLDNAFGDKEHLVEYFDSAFFTRHNSVNFYDAVEKDRIKFVRVSAVEYHFIQTPPWIFTVSYFERTDLNSGWLIKTLVRATPEEAALYKQKLLEE